MRCIDCKYKIFQNYSGGVNRYYCNNPEATVGIGSRLISRTERHSSDLKIKTSPRWCPLNK